MNPIEMGVVYKPLPMGIETLLLAYAAGSAQEQERDFNLGKEPLLELKGDTQATNTRNSLVSVFLSDITANNLLPITTFSCNVYMEQVIFMAKWTMH
jgi:hypothetical protein